MKYTKLYNNYVLINKMIIYNLRIIFANKFIWFLAGSILFYLGLSIIYVFSNDVSKMEDLYGILVFRMIRMPGPLKFCSEYPTTDTKYGSSESYLFS
jgi:hypothetical protein